MHRLLPPTARSDSTLSSIDPPLFPSPSCDSMTTSAFWFQNQKARHTSCRLPSPPTTRGSRKSRGSGCPTLTMALLLHAHCQQPGPSRHHLSLDARHSFLMVPSPEFQLSFMKQPWRPSVRDQESFVRPFGSHLPSASAFKLPASPRVIRLYLAYLISSHYCSQGRLHSGIQCHILSSLRTFIPTGP